jgi:signal recognition particle subunit SRP54
MNGTRRARVAKGSGRPISEVNRLLEQFREMQKMMKKVLGGGGREVDVACCPRNVRRTSV